MITCSCCCQSSNEYINQIQQCLPLSGWSAGRQAGGQEVECWCHSPFSRMRASHTTCPIPLPPMHCLSPPFHLMCVLYSVILLPTIFSYTTVHTLFCSGGFPTTTSSSSSPCTSLLCSSTTMDVGFERAHSLAVVFRFSIILPYSGRWVGMHEHIQHISFCLTFWLVMAYHGMAWRGRGAVVLDFCALRFLPARTAPNARLFLRMHFSSTTLCARALPFWFRELRCVTY